MASLRGVVHTRLKASGGAHPRLAGLSPQARDAVRAAVDANGDSRFFVAAEERFGAQVAAASAGTAGGAAPRGPVASSSQGRPAVGGRYAEVPLPTELSAFQELQAEITEHCTGVASPGGRASNNPKHALRDPRLVCALERYDATQHGRG